MRSATLASTGSVWLPKRRRPLRAPQPAAADDSAFQVALDAGAPREHPPVFTVKPHGGCCYCGSLKKMAYGEVDEGIHSRKLGLAPPNINVTPLIDVLLVLLIIFMVIQPQKEAKFESQIPQKPQDTKDSVVPPSDLLMVDVKMQGAGLDQQVELNSKPMTLM